jgi:DNA-binding Lrp family transcriptional regulator
MVRQYLVPAVTRALEVIELLSKRDAGMSISEIHRALRLPLSSAANIVYTLKALGYLERSEESSRYRLSLKMLGISRRVLGRMDFLERCHACPDYAAQASGTSTRRYPSSSTSPSRSILSFAGRCLIRSTTRTSDYRTPVSVCRPMPTARRIWCTRLAVVSAASPTSRRTLVPWRSF